MRLLTQKDFTKQAWANGRGSTLELYREPAQAARFALRLSVAEVYENSRFSDFPGYQRALGVLSGAGLSLQFDGAKVLTIKRSETQQFPGAPGPWCELIGGPVQDFNAIYDASRWRVELAIVRLGTDTLLDVFAEHSAVYLLEGTLSAPMPISVGELVLFDGAQQLGGVGRMVLVQWSSSIVKIATSAKENP